MNYYEIVVGSQLDSRRVDGFEGMKVSVLVNGNTMISGQIADQAMLYSILTRIRDMGLTLIALNRNDEDESCSK